MLKISELSSHEKTQRKLEGILLSERIRLKRLLYDNLGKAKLWRQ